MFTADKERNGRTESVAFVSIDRRHFRFLLLLLRRSREIYPLLPPGPNAKRRAGRTDGRMAGRTEQSLRSIYRQCNEKDRWPPPLCHFCPSQVTTTTQSHVHSPLCTELFVQSVARFERYGFLTFPQLMGPYSSYLLPKQTYATCSKNGDKTLD